MCSPKIYLTFDLEEFDIPTEFGKEIGWNEQIGVTVSGMKNLLPLLEMPGITATFFTTAAFALEQPALIRTLAAKHEIASHSYWHSSFKPEDLQNSIIALEQVSGQKIYGLRMPRMRQIEISSILEAGFAYDSSINPTWMPGRYNYTSYPRTSFFQNGLLRLPASVSPSLRLPLFWLAFKNYPAPLYRYLAHQTLKKDGYLHLYFHPWEFANLGRYALPGYVKTPSGEKLLYRLERFLGHIKKNAAFDQLKNFKHNHTSVEFAGT